jgi:uncharacterized membrane protein
MRSEKRYNSDHMKTFSICEAFKVGFDRFKAEPLILIGATLLSLLPSFLMEAFEYESRIGEGDVGMIVLVLALTIVSFILYVGLINIALRAERGEKLDWKNLTDKAGLTWKFVLGSLLYGLAVLVGLVLIIIPGIIAAVALSLFSYSLVDGNRGPIESLKESWHLSKGSRWKLLGFIILAQLLNLLGLLLLGVGLLITVPITMIGYAHIYRRLEDYRATLPVVETQPVA